MLNDLSHENSQCFTTLLQSLRKHMDIKLWQEVSETVAQVIDRDVHLIDDWNLANDSLLTTRIPHLVMHTVNNASLSSAVLSGVVSISANDHASSSGTHQVRWQRP